MWPHVISSPFSQWSLNECYSCSVNAMIVKWIHSFGHCLLKCSKIYILLITVKWSWNSMTNCKADHVVKWPQDLGRMAWLFKTTRGALFSHYLSTWFMPQVSNLSHETLTKQQFKIYILIYVLKWYSTLQIISMFNCYIFYGLKNKIKIWFENSKALVNVLLMEAFKFNSCISYLNVINIRVTDMMRP